MGLRYGQSRRDLIDGTTEVSGHCFVTGKPHSVIVPTAGLDRWLDGDVLIQRAMPGVSADVREFLLSGTSPEGWAKTFPEEEG